jgi:1-acyl-sn-glycerol-3-phosphate acyltransferase
VPLWGWVIAVAVVLLAWAAACRRLLDNPRQDVEAGLILNAVGLFVRVVHRLRVEGRENVPAGRQPGPLLVVANHTAGVDPLLVQAACPFEIRWMMASDMRLVVGEPLWRWARVIFTASDPGQVAAAREAMRHLQSGGVLGIFPEGGLERPARRILPFRPVIGMLI